MRGGRRAGVTGIFLAVIDRCKIDVEICIE